jgi:hypothetical protein
MGLQDDTQDMPLGTHTMTLGENGRWGTHPTPTVEKDIAALRAMRREWGDDWGKQLSERWRLWAIEQAKQGNPEPLKGYDQNYAGELVIALQPARMAEGLIAARIRIDPAEPLAVVRPWERAKSGAGVKLTPAPEPAAAPKVDAWKERNEWITKRLKEHMMAAVRRAELTPDQVLDIKRAGRASTHWGTQIDTEFKRLVESDAALSGDVVVSPRFLPKGTVAPDVIDVKSRSWWDLTSTSEEFAEKIPKYEAQYGKGSSLLYKE